MNLNQNYRNRIRSPHAQVFVAVLLGRSIHLTICQRMRKWNVALVEMKTTWIKRLKNQCYQRGGNRDMYFRLK